MDLGTAGLIRDMRKMYVDGASDQELCHRATEIHDMLEKDAMLAGSDKSKHGIVEVERRAFGQILSDIRKGRHARALESYDAYAAKRANQRA